MTRAKRRQLSRVLHGHRWHGIEEWVQSLDELAELTDYEVEELTRLAANDDERESDG